MTIELEMEKLWKTPTEKGWESFSKKLKKSNIKYYRVLYTEKSLKNSIGLKTAHIELYSKTNKLIGNVPLFMTNGKDICGATKYLKGLRNANIIE